ncbi:MAG: cytochrome c [Desulfobulbaceae bacterium]
MKKYLSACVLALCAASLALLPAACGPAGDTAATGRGAEQKKAVDTSPSELYSMQLAPLTPAECGRCHNYQFKWLQDRGGKHQFECTGCHEQFHAYNPRKGNWDEIMPKCRNCHDLPHGQDFTDCMTCHQQPHAPKVIQFEKLEREVSGQKGVLVCAACHKAEGTEFAANPSLHNTEVNCQGCHAEVHGTIPSCIDCHEPHVPMQEYKDCLTCHSPHSASNIRKYPEDVPNVVCSACHDTVYNNLQTNVTKHSSLQCATCHATHGEIPQCQDCHGEPHGEGLHQRFANCLDCHMDPHNLPVNTKK